MRLLTTVLVLVLAAGCGVNRTAAPDPAPTTTEPTTTEPTTTTTPPTTTTTTTTTAPVPATPADGRNLQACADGSCEVEIRSGDVLTVRGEQLTVVDVSANGVTFVLPSGTVASLGGTGTISTASGTNVDVLRNDGTSVLIRVS